MAACSSDIGHVYTRSSGECVHLERLRNRQATNFFAVTLLAAGAPMFLMGDEERKVQVGNNNASGQHNEISWVDWSLLDRHADLLRFVRHLITARFRRDTAVNDPGLTLNQLLRQARITWHGVKLNQPDWGADSHAIAATLWSIRGRFVFHVMINAYWEPPEFEVPPVSGFSGHNWVRWIDTYRESPHDICSWDEAEAVREAVCPVQPCFVGVIIIRLNSRKSSERRK